VLIVGENKFKVNIKFALHRAAIQIINWAAIFFRFFLLDSFIKKVYI
jgi:hypothetical protein